MRLPPRAEVVGSLVRPPTLRRALDALYGTNGDRRTPAPEEQKAVASLSGVVDRAIAEVVAKQLDVGLDVVTDGEFRRYSFDNSLLGAVEGFESDTEPLDFRNAAGEQALWYASKITRRLRKVASPAAADARYLASITDELFKVTFPAGSYELLAYGMQGPDAYGREAYDSSSEALDHIVEIETTLVGDAVRAGARYVQFDYPVYPHLVDPVWIEAYQARGLDRDALLDQAIRMDNAVLAEIPDDVLVAMHICRGNLADKWIAEGSLEPIVERMFSGLDHRTFLLEWDDPSRQGDFSPLRYAPKDVRIVLGLVSTKRKEVEAEDELMRRIEEAAQYVDVSQLAISSQCGFSSSALDNQLDEATQWEKLELIARVASRVWGDA